MRLARRADPFARDGRPLRSVQCTHHPRVDAVPTCAAASRRTEPTDMRSIRLVLLAVAVIAALAACSASETPGWTYAPAPSPTPTPVSSVDISPMPSVASAVPSGGPSQAPGGAVIELAAQNIAYSKDSLQAPAGQTFQIHFTNNDAGVPHNVEIKDANGTSMFKGTIINGVSDVTYSVPALGSGNYQFVCSVHPNMVGTLVVG